MTLTVYGLFRLDASKTYFLQDVAWILQEHILCKLRNSAPTSSATHLLFPVALDSSKQII